jgi:hypothetical protein
VKDSSRFPVNAQTRQIRKALKMHDFEPKQQKQTVFNPSVTGWDGGTRTYHAERSIRCGARLSAFAIFLFAI